MNINVIDAVERERFEAHDEQTGELAGFVTYQVTGSIVVYTHTEVKPAFEGKGIGSLLARTAMDDAKARGRTVIPICPFLSTWLDKHPEYKSITAEGRRLPGGDRSR